eukprot:353992-Chlamydomonas_euryale.AAC.3
MVFSHAQSSASLSVTVHPAEGAPFTVQSNPASKGFKGLGPCHLATLQCPHWSYSWSEVHRSESLACVSVPKTLSPKPLNTLHLKMRCPHAGGPLPNVPTTHPAAVTRTTSSCMYPASRTTSLPAQPSIRTCARCCSWRILCAWTFRWACCRRVWGVKVAVGPRAE